MKSRPTLATVIGALLCLLAALGLLAGLVVSWASTCCGTSDPSASSGPVLAGILVAAALGASAAGFLTGRMTRGTLGVLTLVLPVACVVASFSSMDLANLAPVTVVAWIALCLLMRRGPLADWLGSRAAVRHPRS